MSLYLQGARFSSGKKTLAGVGADSRTEAEWKAANDELQAAIKHATSTFPKSFTEERAAQLLEAAVIYGRKMLSRYGGFFSGVDSGSLQVAINTADDASKKWRSKIPWMESNAYHYTQGQNREWAEVNAQVMRIYVEAAGIIGQKVVINEARRELANDLNPTTANNMMKTALVIGGVVAAFMVITNGKIGIGNLRKGMA